MDSSLNTALVAHRMVLPTSRGTTWNSAQCDVSGGPASTA